MNDRNRVFWATSWFFFILLSYSIVRPVRETMGAIAGTRQLQNLMLMTFIAMLIAVPAYAALIDRLPRRWVVRIVFHFFTASLVGFSIALQFGSTEIQVTTARLFFLWVNIFGVFATSVFWSVLADIYNSDQGKRLFGTIAAGGTSGAILGSFLTSQLAIYCSTSVLLILPALAIQIGLICAWRLESASERSAQFNELSNNLDQKTIVAEPRRTSASLMAGITRLFQSPYLASICLFLFFAQAAGTMLYFQQAEIVAANVADKTAKIQLFAYLDLGTQLLTLVAQTLISSRLLRLIGISWTLVLLPIVYLISFTTLACSPSLSVLIVAVLASRASAYGITVPAREVLFTVVDREDKYKSKSFIDTVVLRGGDAISSQLFGSLRSVAQVGTATLNWWSLPWIAVWGFAAWRLGKRQQKLAASLPQRSE